MMVKIVRKEKLTKKEKRKVDALAEFLRKKDPWYQQMVACETLYNEIVKTFRQWTEQNGYYAHTPSFDIIRGSEDRMKRFWKETGKPFEIFCTHPDKVKLARSIETKFSRGSGDVNVCWKIKQSNARWSYLEPVEVKVNRADMEANAIQLAEALEENIHAWLPQAKVVQHKIQGIERKFDIETHGIELRPQKADEKWEIIVDIKYES